MERGEGEEVVVADQEAGAGSMELEFEKERVPTWREQVTVRALVTSLVLNLVFNFIVCKLNLTTGVIPSLNVAAGLLGFAILKSYEVVLKSLGWLRQPFTRQENTVIQTCVVACAGVAFSSGSASYIMGMTPIIAAQSDGGNTPVNMKKLSLGWMIAFNLLVSFGGLFSISFLRKTMILDYKLTYPSGTATATLINSFHTSKGAKLAKQQVKKLMSFFSLSFIWAFFQWFFTAGGSCGFNNFPSFGLQAFNKRFYFDFSATYVGVGMICPYMVNISLLIGAILSWLVMWPLIQTKKGDWYSAEVSDSSLHGINGYRVFIAISTMLGDGVFHVLYMLIQITISLVKKHRSKQAMSSVATVDDDNKGAAEVGSSLYDDRKRAEYFLKDQIPMWLAGVGYLALAILSIVCVPLIFPQLKWYHIATLYAVAPVLAFCNAYGCGLSDWSLASNYGKVAILVLSAWVGPESGGIIAGLAACGVMMNITSTASDLMQDFKTGYLTLSSPRSMMIGQIAGTFMGCVFSPPVFWLFYKAYPIGDPTGSYPAPYASLYRAMAVLGSQGFGSLPKHCLALAAGFFVGAFVVCAAKEAMKRKGWRAYQFVPSPMCIAIPFYLGGYFAIDMAVGSLVVFVWTWMNKKSADTFTASVASGLICGDSLWGIPAAILALAGVAPPLCLRVLSSSDSQKVAALLGS